MLPHDALELLQETARRAAEPTLLKDVSTDREKIYAIDGKTEFIQVDPQPRRHAVSSLEDLIAYANRAVSPEQRGVVADDEEIQKAADGQVAEAEFAAPPVVWFNERQVVLDLDPDGHRLDTVTLAFVRSDVFARILRLRENPEWLDQKDFVRMLRIELFGCLSDHVLLEPARKLKFENGQTVSSTVARDRESIGKSIAAQVQSESGELPETVALTFRMHTTSGEDDLFILDAAVEVDAMRGKLRLTPMPDEVERVLRLFVDTVRSRLGDGLSEEIPAFYGKP